MIQRFLLLLLFSVTGISYAAPFASWYLDELGTAGYTYDVDDAIGTNDGTAYHTPSTGNASGKICSAFDFSASSIADYAVLGKDSLNGAGDFTISAWHKGSSTAGRSLLSGARTAQNNELLMWFTNGTSFNGYINGAASGAVTFPSIADNLWHHIVWRRSGTQSCIFTDGVQRGCKTITNKVLEIDSLVLAQEQDNVGGAFDINQDWEGLVDEFLVFRNALTNAEILSVYNNQNAGNSWNGGARTCLTTPPPAPVADMNYSDWHFDEAGWNGTVNEVVDSHDSNHGIGFNVSAVPGKVCNAMDLRASSTTDYAKLGAASLNGVNDFTISVWNKSVSPNGKSLLSGAKPGSFNELIFWHTSSTIFNGHLSGSASLGTVPTSNIADNNWHHLVWRRENGQSCYFIDTQLQGCQATLSSSTLGITSLVLGQEQDTLGGGFSSAQDWEGLVDELLIFRRSLDTAEITSIYNNQNNGKNWDGSFRACLDMPSMTLTKTSTIISDPVNLTNNPKRIPGAIVRYTIIAENSHAAAAEHMIIKDDLTEEISLGTINWHGNIKVTSPNINGGATTSLTDATSDDQGDFIANKLSVKCGDITNAAPCTVTYDVEISQ